MGKPKSCHMTGTVYTDEQRYKSDVFYTNIDARMRKKSVELAKKIIINGVHYDSLKHASRKLQISHTRLITVYKELQKTRLSEIEKTLSVSTHFIFKLPKDINGKQEI